MKNIAYLTIACLLAVTALGNLFPWAIHGDSWGVTEFEVLPGATAEQVAQVLSDRGLIANEDLFVLGAVLLRLDRSIVSGKYVIQPRTGLLSLYDLLKRGQQHLNLVTVPEGLTLAETAAILAEELGVEAEELERWAGDPELLSSLGIEGSTAEGYIFPDTYDIPQGTDPRDIVSTMVRRALQAYSDARLLGGSVPELTMKEVFILASIVEAEVTVDEEGPRVAAVFINRLRKGMPLQADPTVAYALGARKRRITYRDLEVDSPYNTYRHSGLPPGPICNPGERSLHAVLNPLEGSGEFYFVATGDGRHIFSKTRGEHVRAKQMVRSRRKAGTDRRGPGEGAADDEGETRAH